MTTITKKTNLLAKPVKLTNISSELMTQSGKLTSPGRQIIEGQSLGITDETTISATYVQDGETKTLVSDLLPEKSNDTQLWFEQNSLPFNGAVLTFTWKGKTISAEVAIS